MRVSFLVKSFVASVMVLIAAPSFAANASLTIASCPPWKHGANDAANQKMAQMCQIDSAKITDALSAYLPIEKKNQHALLQADATPANLYGKLDELRDVVSPGDTLYLFQMSHGGVLPHTYKGYPVKAEVFAYYTEKAPKDYSKAVGAGQWLSARELRDALSQFAKDTGANVLVIIEACHSSSAGHQLVHNPIERLEDDEKVAYIFSAGAGQTSTFTNDMSGARFTEEFVSALGQAESGTSLADVFSTARDATHRGALAHCNNLPAERRTALFRSVDQYFESCLQDASFFYPKGLLLDLKTN